MVSLSCLWCRVNTVAMGNGQTRSSSSNRSISKSTNTTRITLGLLCYTEICLQCFDADGWAAGRGSGENTEWWSAGMVNCLERDADLHMAQLMPLPLTISCFKLVLSFWYRLTQVVPEKRAIEWVCVCYTQISDNKEADVEIMPSYQGPDFHNFFKWS